ncbi:MAG: PDZ domain-containing protein [Oscillatoriales cyanobacterium RM1_1_9]|nr:PDZ domain-containing protein [Oscillatoriales cyanobacterium SM2_3_0]NJO46573.1 PDZ domain-containing protein [Oscillatoriales cyanobacterium RM2_1_1]NJO71116.1 PDZ domain-containing protein [Oscillatoriales cyanobacterium RM1_1_9]
MNHSTDRKLHFWRQPALYLVLLLLGAGAALAGENWLRARLFPADPGVEQAVEGSPTALPEAKPGARSPVWQMPKPNSDVSSPTPSNFIVTAVEQVGPAVVRINASRRVGSGFDQFNQPFPEEFFEGRPAPPDSLERGTGSGFILTSEGHILTNSHVVEGSETVEVVLKDGRWFDGEVLGIDPVTDVAVVKIQAKNLPTVPIGNSDTLSPGEWAIAIGNPLGLDNSVTVGIISATGRSSTDVGVPDKRIGFIQTDAAINPGNSGGPLLNAQGQVIGMNTAIIDGAQGLGFAIPIDKAKEIAEQLIATGRAEHAYLGIEMVALTPETKRQVQDLLGDRVKADQGVLVVRVAPGSPAERFGLKPGDVLRQINGRPIIKSEIVQEVVQSEAVGSSLKIEVDRNGQILNLNIKTGNLPPA